LESDRFLKNQNRMQALVGSDLLLAGELIGKGRLVAFPTETVYGLGADALNPAAVARIFEAKGRPRFDPLIVHVNSLQDMEPLVAGFPPMAERLAAEFWPGPLTLVLRKTSRVPDLVTSGLDTVAVRIPRHPIAQKLLDAAGVPIAAPSANRFGRLSPTRAEHVLEQLGEQIDYILDGGPCEVGVESTVVDLTTHPPRLLRPGGVALEVLQAVIGELELIEQAIARETPRAPGMLTKHYAPQTRVLLLDDFQQLPSDRGECGLLTLAPLSHADEAGFLSVESLSESGDLREAATNFFAALRRLDGVGAERIVAVRFPNIGLGRALNDRLQRAANTCETEA
jgi:L-threonylcarbamoyladenylate synthase